MKNVLEMLEKSTEQFPQKIIFADENKSLSFAEFTDIAKKVGTGLAKNCSEFGANIPVAVLFPRSVENLAGMMSVTYSGNFYAVLDADMPLERMEKILSTLCPKALLYDERCKKTADELSFDGKKLCFDELAKTNVDDALLGKIRENMIDTDPLYALFTSGSTGMPKGAVLSHKNVLCYSKWFCECFDITENTVFGSQTPFYFSMSVSDVFGTIRTGATLNIIPKTYFTFPMKLLEYLNERHVNTIYWVPSALCIVANWKALDYADLPNMTKVLFAGEVMPVKQLNYWIKKLPNALYANLFGPTETTDICTYYVVNRAFSDDETLPIGNACNNCDVFVVNDKGEKAAPDEEGELFARGSFLAMGYYNNPEKTAAAFVQNPLQKAYPEVVYKTGDLVKYNEQGELIYITRRDFQIKRMGYRIELGEIEAAAGAVDNVTACAALYDKASDKLVLIAQGRKLDDGTIRREIAARVPAYMMPDIIAKTKQMPYNQNGKIDRKWLMAHYTEL